MEECVIRIEGNLSASVFYRNIVSNLSAYLSSPKEKYNVRVILDLTETEFVDALVIPNLLCIGYLLKKNCTCIPVISTVNSDVYVDSSRLMRYFNDIGFLEYAKDFGLYTFRDFGYMNDSHRFLPDFCTTFLFNDANVGKSQSAEQIQREKRQIAEHIYHRSYELFTKYLDDYYDDDEIYGYMNTFVKFAAELCHNAQFHGDSFAFMTMQVNKATGKLNIAVSDIGKGFYESILNKILQDKLGHDLYFSSKENYVLHDKKAELDAIVEGTFYRYFDPIYGVTSVAQRVIDCNGIIRIHSDNTRIILTRKSFSGFFSRCGSPESLRNLLQEELINKQEYNIQSGFAFPGVHYEIEMPIMART